MEGRLGDRQTWPPGRSIPPGFRRRHREGVDHWNPGSGRNLFNRGTAEAWSGALYFSTVALLRHLGDQNVGESVILTNSEQIYERVNRAN